MEAITIKKKRERENQTATGKEKHESYSHLFSNCFIPAEMAILYYVKLRPGLQKYSLKEQLKENFYFPKYDTLIHVSHSTWVGVCKGNSPCHGNSLSF